MKKNWVLNNVEMLSIYSALILVNTYAHILPISVMMEQKMKYETEEEMKT